MATGLEVTLLRSALGTAFGCVVTTALGAMAGNVVFHGGAAGRPPITLLVMLLLMRALAAVAGGYAAAAIARRRPVTHGLAAGVLYLVTLQFAPRSLVQLASPLVLESIGTAVAAIALTLVGAAVGGAARGQGAR